jgi:hypothetical protein
MLNVLNIYYVLNLYYINNISKQTFTLTRLGFLIFKMAYINYFYGKTSYHR